MNPHTTPTFRRYYFAWCLAWLTLSSAALCGASLVWLWSVRADGFSLWSVIPAMGLGPLDAVSVFLVSSELLVCALICAGIQFLIWTAVDTFAPRITAEHPLATSKAISGGIGGALFLLLLSACGVAKGGQWQETSSIGPFLVLWTPIAGAAVTAGWKCCVVADRGRGYSRLWTAVAGFVVAALYIAGAETPRFIAGQWTGQTGESLSVYLDFESPSKGTLDRWAKLDSLLSHQQITYKKNGRDIILLSDPKSQVIATGTMSEDAQSITLHIANPPETVTLTRYYSD